MRLPYIVSKNLDKQSIENWEKHYETPKYGWDRKIEEGLWRRTQEFNTRRQSGWKAINDKRRRIVHYLHTYDLIHNEDGTKDLALTATYLWIHLCFPKTEINDYSTDIREGLKNKNWIKERLYTDVLGNHEVYTKESLDYKITFMDRHPQDIQHNRQFPEEYCILEITVASRGYQVALDILQKPWDVFNRGQRRKDYRGNPYIDSELEKIPELFPAQIELGCGPSIEAGIPPLNFLHKVYYVTDKEANKFILGAKNDRLAFDVANNTEKAYELFSTMYKRCFFAKPTKFHYILKFLHKENMIVGSIITNNFDGLPLKLDLEEKYVRRYEEQHIIPNIDFHPDAKALIVVGSHADRRKIHAAARNKGMKIIYIDPEGYFEDDNFMQYELEDPQDGDIIFKESSVRAFEKILEKLIEKGKIGTDKKGSLPYEVIT